MRYAVSTLGIILFLGTAGIAAATPASGASEVEAQLAKMIALSGDEYVAARSALLEIPREIALPILLARRTKAAWSESSWREDVIVDAAIVWFESPALAQKMYALDGLDPAKYRLRRRPDPEVARELKTMKRVSAILFEIELKTWASYPLLSRDAGALAKERSALATGLLIAAASSRHPAAPHLLKSALLDDQQPIAVRRVAAIGLGQTNVIGAFGVLAPISQDRALDAVLRGGAIAGLGQIRSMASFEVLARLASGSEGPEIRAPAIAALGTLGNVWVLRRSRVNAGENLREKTARALTAILASPDGARYETQLIEAMVMIAHPVLRTELGALIDGPAKDRAQRALARVDLAARRES
jgi:hypothetical protein